jgi:hypothetical protein
MAAQMSRKAQRPHGNYQHSEHQWGVIAAVNDGPPPSVDVWLDGSQVTGDPVNITTGLSYLSSYSPMVDDVVLVYRGYGKNRSDRLVLGDVAGQATPYPLLLGSIDPSTRRYTQGPNALWGGVGIPSNSLGIDGDWYFRTDTPNILGQELYYKYGGEWTPLLGGDSSTGVTALVAGTNVSLEPPGGTGVVTVSATGAVSSLIAGTNITLDPPSGVGDVTINATSSGGGSGVTVGSNAWLLLAVDNVFFTGSIVYANSGQVESANITWPDNTTGVYTATLGQTFAPQDTVIAQQWTYFAPTTLTVFQPTMSYDSNGLLTAQPARYVA